MIEEIRSIKSGRSELRKFGVTVGIALAVFGGIFLWRGKDFYPYLFYIGAGFLFFGLVLPVVLWPVQKFWMTLAILLGWVMTRVILSVLFYVIVTPIGLCARLFGKDFLDMKFGGEADSYWIPKDPEEKTKRDYESQF
jgi:hypothetical protein